VRKAGGIAGQEGEIEMASGMAVGDEKDKQDKLETMPEVRLWQAVIARAVEEWVSGPLRRQREAERHLFDDTDFEVACGLANMSAARLREKLLKCRKRAAPVVDLRFSGKRAA
jgi:hypothetical protein